MTAIAEMNIPVWNILTCLLIPILAYIVYFMNVFVISNFREGRGIIVPNIYFGTVGVLAVIGIAVCIWSLIRNRPKIGFVTGIIPVILFLAIPVFIGIGMAWSANRPSE